MADPFNLDRFVEAQEPIYQTALAEISRGAKRSHWMWFIFPQLAALGQSPTAKHYGIGSIEEARAYLDHPVLGDRLRECAQAIQNLSGTRAEAVFGPIDTLKLRSSLTLFSAVSNEAIFAAGLCHWFDSPDPKTLNLLK